MYFFTTFHPTLLGAWIPAGGMILLQMVCMSIFKEGGKRAVDTSWYDTRTKRFAILNTLFQMLFIAVAVFVPFKCGTLWFVVGAIVYVVALALFVWSFWSYCTANRDKLITKGIYRYSRNPMYVVFTIGFFGIAIASASLWLLLVLIPYVWAMHGTILGEEQYCEKTFGDDYREYKRRVPRYLILK